MKLNVGYIYCTLGSESWLCVFTNMLITYDYFFFFKSFETTPMCEDAFTCPDEHMITLLHIHILICIHLLCCLHTP